MNGYRLYTITTTGVIAGPAEWLQVENDDEAVALVDQRRADGLADGLELWSGTLLVHRWSAGVSQD
jgi:hypothetical protein